MASTPTLRAPGPRGLPLTGSLWWVRRDTLGFLLSARARYGDVLRLRMGHLVIHVVSSPAGVKHVLKTASRNFVRTTATNARLIDIVGHSLLTTDGKAWESRRKAIAPLMTPERSGQITPMVARLSNQMITRWCSADIPVVINPDLMELTLAIMTEVLFGVPIGSDAARMERALSVVLEHHWRRVQSPLDLPHVLPTSSKRSFTAGTKELRAILARLRSAAPSDHIAGIMARLSDLNADDELLTLLLAGHETTANALAWALWLLATHPEHQQRLYDEAVAVLGERQPTPADLPQLVHATHVFEEAMRLYPPIWLLDRQAVAEDEIGGYRIPADSTVVIAPWLVHRHPEWWSEPERFDPDRFVKRPAPFTYIPFGAGPHGCVGGHLAMVEGPLILALLMRRIRLRPADRAQPKPLPGLTLRMTTPLRLLVEQR